MEKQQAQRIIRETFENSFDKNRFILFIKNLFNTINEERFTYRGNYIPDAYKQYIKLLERIGKFTDGENSIDILIVTLQKETSLERARTMQRNFIAWYLNGSRGGAMKDAALVAFVSPNETDWRFSLVKMDYRFEQTKAGNVKVKEEFTPARRWSFLVGANEKSHTAQSRLVEILANDEQAPTLLEIEEAFNIEIVTKEFFLKYRELFLRTKEEMDKAITKDLIVKAEFEAKSVDTVSFAKKLLGQIVFLYFLQKKGWFGVERNAEWGDGSKQFLRKLFEGKYGKYNNFFNDILEPLFYEALRLEHSGDYYSRFNCRIPFLNGGLFDPINNYDWWNTDICLSNDIFSNDNKTKEGDIGDGIFDIFDRYNFTVKEDEPLEKEVAIDPEMLGKVFENLLEVKDRKSKGTYYTPREIVHYMCQESLANYLSTELTGKASKKDIETLIKYGESVVENDSHVVNEGRETGRYTFLLPQSMRKHAKLVDEKLASIRICDPAVGSGAFPVGIMNEIIWTRRVLTPYIGDNGERTPYHYKRQAIQNCLYGVDIDPGAVEITKLRLWLSLIVDEEERETIQPLPNLDYKIMQGNSLLSEFMGIDFDKEDVGKNGQLFIAEDDVNTLVEKLKDKKNEYLNKAGVSEKQKLKHEIEDLIIEIFETKLKKQKTNYFSRVKAIEEKYKNLTNKEQRETIIQKEKGKLYETSGFSLEQFERQLREYTSGNKARPFFPWRLYFAEVFHEKKGFDVVISNPPYIGESGHKELFRDTKKGTLKKYYLGKMDYFYFFFHLALNISKTNGEIVFITTNYYLTATGAFKLRTDFQKRAMIRKLISFNELRIFESAKGQHNIITLLCKCQSKLPAKTCITYRKGDAKSLILDSILNWGDDRTQYYEIPQLELYEGKEKYIRIDKVNSEGSETSRTIDTILDKVSDQGCSLSSIANINQGVVSGCDYVSKKNIKKIENDKDIKLGNGIFVFSLTNPRDIEVIKKFTLKEKTLLRSFFKNSDIDKYWCKSKEEKLLLYLGKKQYDISQYPNIQRHLNRFKGILNDRREVLNGKIKYHQLQWCRTEEIFTNRKIVVPYRARYNSFAYNNQEWFCRSDCYIITQKDNKYNLKYLLSLLNSSLYYKWLYHKGKKKGEILELFRKPLSEIPIKNILPTEQKPFIEFADKILTITKDDDYLENFVKQAKVREYEKLIDQLVYKIYGLTPEEIEIVEGKNGDAN
jgi:hypothetical protein